MVCVAPEPDHPGRLLAVADAPGPGGGAAVGTHWHDHRLLATARVPDPPHALVTTVLWAQGDADQASHGAIAQGDIRGIALRRNPSEMIGALPSQGSGLDPAKALGLEQFASGYRNSQGFKRKLEAKGAVAYCARMRSWG